MTGVVGPDHPLAWVVVGAASNGRKYYQSDPDDVARLLRVLDGTHTPVFYKGNIAPLFKAHDFGTEALNRWREDFPTCYRDGAEIPAVAERQRQCLQHGWTRVSLL